ncbi:unnamed protein product [Zymoseptoria tritici ST99CH_1A5]|uniref:Vacuolar sorting protein Vps3844 C-terminal domain-containing protein n=4 Tax=Zymoseptoria tritici TaxID=1047171 RepID=F9XAF2_ZYMTI|nr:uncharacterized protein MYCGRDRAFT_109278 [Zymoseptoria tritici IPO323]SMQ50270.1 unnamed protein product [Zymoseptoria tritici ST99CH_3D7]SMR51248.1 unnamed protein product [Zymoseptoria tritici ST99CH_1E4]SMR52303.1 unnamed protein product [Zymoseptoria tritici ST99CH_3D1]SMY23941.1 unnamed protein product [Zymoseptoria tritici ST99CH_1A5]EGP88235.1 hypothetical protein MYCGRDRAFT_109278 [Zymoseptoria tritici IPO323]
MKLSASTILPALAHLASASTARIHIHDPQQRDVQSRDVSPVAARLVLAQRTGVEDYHNADLEQDDVIDAINDYGLQTPMFADKAAGCERKAFLLYEGEEHIEALSSYTSFDLSPAPASSAIRGLMLDLARQSDPKQLLKLSDEILLDRLQSIQYMSSPLFFLTTSSSHFTSELNRLVKESYCITTLTTPLDTSSTATSKFQWGTYTLPKLNTKRSVPEKLLSEAHASLSSGSHPALHASANHSSSNSSSEPLRGILPACFTSLSACESTTRNCTGHGTCRKAYRDPDRGSNGLDCYSCSCVATKSADGKKTTTWAGPACQKKDVSVEFWLIALFTIAMMGLVGFAVGSVWEMGSEELPSVIGAGVSGPTARK